VGETDNHMELKPNGDELDASWPESGSWPMDSDRLQWFDHNADNPPFIKALAEVRQLLRSEKPSNS
jgi:hypothetical protein